MSTYRQDKIILLKVITHVNIFIQVLTNNYYIIKIHTQENINYYIQLQKKRHSVNIFLFSNYICKYVSEKKVVCLFKIDIFIVELMNN